MVAAFYILAGLILVSAGAALLLRNLVHCALFLILCLAGLGILYLTLSAEFVGFAQILVYVGAVGILVLFAILLTRGGQEKRDEPGVREPLIGGAIALLVCGVLISVILSRSNATPAPLAPAVSVEQLGKWLMQDYVLPLEVLGLLLTVAMIGAAIIALPRTDAEEDEQAPVGPDLNS